MDRSTLVTVRSAIVIACMILVPLWAVVGGSWTSALPERSAERHSRSIGDLQSPRSEPRREPIVQAEFPAVDLPATTPAGANEPAPDAPLHDPARIEPLPAVTAATPSIRPTPNIRPIETQVVEAAVQRTTNISSETATTPLTSSPPPASMPIPPPNTSNPGDWFQWTEARLRQLGASQFILESSNDQGGYRFRCKAPLPTDPGFMRHFEATGESALIAMQTVLQQIEQWRAGVK